METKWYSDFLQLLVCPFSKGIDQIVEHGTLKKGFWGTVVLCAIPYIVLALFASVFAALLPDAQISSAMALAGASVGFLYIVIWLISLLISFAVVAIESYVFNWVIKKLGGTDDVNALMKVQWYLYGYGSIFSTIAYIALAILIGIFVAIFDSTTLTRIIYVLGVIAMFAWSIWISLALIAKQVKLTKFQVFLAGLITWIIFVLSVLLLVFLVGGCAAVVGR